MHARLMADGIRMGSASSSHSLVGMRKGPEGQLELFASQLSGVDKEGQLACMSIANRIRRPRDTSQRRGAGGDEKKASNDGLPSVVLSARYSYRIPEPPATSHYVEAGSPGNDDEEDKGWDVGAAWRPWATYSDPVGCIELDLAWHNVNLSSISIAGEGEMQGEVKGVGMGYDGNSDDGDSDGDSGNESSIQWSEILKPSESDHWSIHVLKSPGGCWTRTAKGGILSLSSSSNENQGRARQREYVDVLDEPASTNPGNFSSFRNRNAKGESYQRQEESGVVSHQKGPRHPVGSTVTTMHHDLSSSQKLGRGERRPDSLDWSESDHSFTMMLSALACATEGKFVHASACNLVALLRSSTLLPATLNHTSTSLIYFLYLTICPRPCQTPISRELWTISPLTSGEI